MPTVRARRTPGDERVRATRFRRARGLRRRLLSLREADGVVQRDGAPAKGRHDVPSRIEREGRDDRGQAVVPVHPPRHQRAQGRSARPRSISASFALWRPSSRWPRNASGGALAIGLHDQSASRLRWPRSGSAPARVGDRARHGPRAARALGRRSTLRSRRRDRSRSS